MTALQSLIKQKTEEAMGNSTPIALQNQPNIDTDEIAEKTTELATSDDDSLMDEIWEDLTEDDEDLVESSTDDYLSRQSHYTGPSAEAIADFESRQAQEQPKKEEPVAYDHSKYKDLSLQKDSSALVEYQERVIKSKKGKTQQGRKAIAIYTRKANGNFEWAEFSRVKNDFLQNKCYIAENKSYVVYVDEVIKAEEQKIEAETVAEKIDKENKTLTLRTPDRMSMQVSNEIILELINKSDRVHKVEGTDTEYELKYSYIQIGEETVHVTPDNLFYLYTLPRINNGTNCFIVPSTQTMKDDAEKEAQNSASPYVSATPLAQPQTVNTYVPQQSNPEVTKYRYANDTSRAMHDAVAQGNDCKGTPQTRDGYAMATNYATSGGLNKDYDEMYKVETSKVNLGGTSKEIENITKNCQSIVFDGKTKQQVFHELAVHVWLESLIEELQPIRSIAVVQNKVIINGVAYNVSLSEAEHSKLSIVESRAIKRGSTYNMFFEAASWFRREEIQYVSEIIFDDGTQAMEILRQFTQSNKIGTTTFFKVFRNLNTLTIEGKTVTREELYTAKSVEVKEKMQREHRGWSLFDNFTAKHADKVKEPKEMVSDRNYKFCGWQAYEGGFRGMGDDLQGFFLGKIKENAQDSNKGIVRRGIGLVGSSALWVASGILNLGFHITGHLKDKAFG